MRERGIEWKRGREKKERERKREKEKFCFLFSALCPCTFSVENSPKKASTKTSVRALQKKTNSFFQIVKEILRTAIVQAERIPE